MKNSKSSTSDSHKMSIAKGVNLFRSSYSIQRATIDVKAELWFGAIRSLQSSCKYTTKMGQAWKTLNLQLILSRFQYIKRPRKALA
mgnify:CR=1 FL=1